MKKREPRLAVTYVLAAVTLAIASAGLWGGMLIPEPSRTAADVDRAGFGSIGTHGGTPTIFPAVAFHDRSWGGNPFLTEEERLASGGLHAWVENPAAHAETGAASLPRLTAVLGFEGGRRLVILEGGTAASSEQIGAVQLVRMQAGRALVEENGDRRWVELAARDEPTSAKDMAW